MVCIHPYYKLTIQQRMKNSRTEHESYLHKAAKEVLAQWIVEYEKFNERPQCVSKTEEICLSWRDNWSNELKNVEYPFSDTTCIQNWREVDRLQDDKRSSYESALIQRHHVYAVIDVVIIHKGYPNYLFEICHKNPVTSKKLQSIRDCCKKNGSPAQFLIEIDASWIMSQITRPQVLKVKNIYPIYPFCPFSAKNVRILSVEEQGVVARSL